MVRVVVQVLVSQPAVGGCVLAGDAGPQIVLLQQDHQAQACPAQQLEDVDMEVILMPLGAVHIYYVSSYNKAG